MVLMTKSTCHTMLVLMAAASERWAALCTSTVTNTSAGPRRSRLQVMIFLIESARQRNLERMWQTTKKLLLFFSSLSWRLWLVAGSFV